MFDWLRRLGRGPLDGAQRWVVVDVETSGFDPSRDALLSVGAVGMRADGRVVPADSLEIIYRAPGSSSRQNVLVHGIGWQAQAQGMDPAQATRRFLDFIGAAPLVAFHAAFDRGFIARAVKVYVNQPFGNPWLDVAELAPALDEKAKFKSLDEWLGHYSVPVSTRHSAAADAFATALLLARLLPAARRHGAGDFLALQKLARQAKWLHN
jgi:DNA polymerase-3 subunit epsilon